MTGMRKRLKYLFLIGFASALNERRKKTILVGKDTKNS